MAVTIMALKSPKRFRDVAAIYIFACFPGLCNRPRTSLMTVKCLEACRTAM